MEKLGFSHSRFEQSENTLNSPAIPVEVQPIVHVGLGVAAMESCQFQPATISEFIESRAHPDYHLFPYETIGCIWAVYEKKFFQFVFRVMSRSRIASSRPSLLPK